MIWSGSSSTRGCCGWVSILRTGSAMCLSGCGRRRWMPTATRMCRSSGWSSSSTRCAPRRIIRCFRWPWPSRTMCAPRWWRSTGSASSRWRRSTGTAKFDLDFELSEVPTEDPAAPMAAGVVSYATDLFDRATIERLVTWFGRVIEAVVADASVVVGEVSLLDRGERDLVLSGWSGADVGGAGGGGDRSCWRRRWRPTRTRWRCSTVRGRCRIASLMSGRRGWRGC